MLHADVSWVDQPRKSLEIHLLRWFSTFYHEKSQFNHHVGNRYFFSNHLKQIKVLTLWFCPILKNCWIFRINPTSSEVEVEKDWMAIRSCNMSSGVVTINEVLIHLQMICTFRKNERNITPFFLRMHCQAVPFLFWNLLFGKRNVG